MAKDISNIGSDTDSKWLSVRTGETHKITLKSLKIEEPDEDGHSPTIEIVEDKKEKKLNLPTVLRSILEAAIEKKEVRVGSQIEITCTGKQKGKSYYMFKVIVLRK